MSDFWVYNASDMDFNVKFKGGKYRVEAGKTVDLVLATQGQLTADQLEDDAQVNSYIGRGFWVRVNGPESSENVALDEVPIVAEVVPAATGRTDRSVIMKPTTDPDADSKPSEPAQANLPGKAEVHDKTTVISAPPSPVEESPEPSPLGMVEANTANLPGALAINPPPDIEFAGGLTPDENMRLASNLQKAEQARALRIRTAAESAVLSNRLDESRCSATTGSGTQCRNKKVEGGYCKTPKHAKLVK